jgi:hypothetical protein
MPADLTLVDPRFQRVAAGANADSVQTLAWSDLSELNYQTGFASLRLRRANGHTVRIPGFIVPLEDFAEEASEFLLVPYFGACVHTPSPPPNQLVLVRMARPAQLMDTWARPVWVEGTLSIENVESFYGTAGYRVRGLRVLSYDDKHVIADG